MVNISRRTHLARQIIFVDGLSGSGKTALFKAVSSIDRVEMTRIEPICDYICILRFLDRMPEDAAIALLRLQLDRILYNMMISREINFRPDDMTTILDSPLRSRYLERLFLSDGPVVQKRIDKEHPILQIMTHQLLGISFPLFQAFEDRFVIIEMVRDPLFIINAWFSYFDRYGTDPFEFTICMNHNGNDLPWFTRGWERIFVGLNKMDRIIKSIEFLAIQKKGFLKNLSTKNSQKILQIPFEKFVVDPWPYINQIEGKLGAHCLPDVQRILHDQNIPREVTLDVPDKSAFKKYGYHPLKKEASEQSIKEAQWHFIEENASIEGLKLLERLCEDYQKEYLENG